MKEKKKIALALGGGGIKGFAHIGVLKALEELDIEITHIGGTSVGSLVGALYSIYGKASIIEEFSKELDDKAMVNSYYESVRTSHKKDLLLLFIKQYLERKTFKDCKIPIVVVVLDINTGEKKYIKSGSIVDAVRASCSLPFVFGYHRYNNHNFVDGGIAENVPVEAVRSIGGEKVLGVGLESYKKNTKEKFSYKDLQIGMVSGLMYHSTKKDLQLAEKQILFDLTKYTILQILKNRQDIIDMAYKKTIKIMKDY
ncbi:MAG: patatin-like phospholipase family protein [Candidatus Dojkabacteria bacterium]